MRYVEIDSYTVLETIRRAAQRGRLERWVDRFNGWFWRLLGA
jgi:hypothetical protein